METLLRDLHAAIGTDGMIKMSWNRLHGWCIIATNSKGISFVGKDPVLEKVVTRCSEFLSNPGSERAKTEPLELISVTNDEIADVIVTEGTLGRFSVIKNRYGSHIHDINVTALSLVLSDLIDRKGRDLIVVWKKPGAKKAS